MEPIEYNIFFFTYIFFLQRPYKGYGKCSHLFYHWFILYLYKSRFFYNQIYIYQFSIFSNYSYDLYSFRNSTDNQDLVIANGLFCNRLHGSFSTSTSVEFIIFLCTFGLITISFKIYDVSIFFMYYVQLIFSIKIVYFLICACDKQRKDTVNQT